MPGINCGLDCNELFDEDMAVTLNVTADSGYQFDGWSGDCIGIASCDLTMDEAKNVTATFTVLNSANSFTLQWAEPSFLENGDALSHNEIASYDIHWGVSPTSMALLTQITDREVVEYVVPDLDPGEYFFSISVTTIYGTQSDPSNIISKIIE